MLGYRKMRELLLTGDTIDAPEALACGLVTRVVPGDELRGAVDEYIARIAPTPLEVLRLTKIALNRAAQAMGLLEAVEANLDLSAMLNGADTPGAGAVRGDRARERAQGGAGVARRALRADPRRARPELIPG